MNLSYLSRLLAAAVVAAVVIPAAALASSGSPGSPGSPGNGSGGVSGGQPHPITVAPQPRSGTHNVAPQGAQMRATGTLTRVSAGGASLLVRGPRPHPGLGIVQIHRVLKVTFSPQTVAISGATTVPLTNLRVGMLVRVTGPYDRATDTVSARQVVILADQA